MALQNTWVTYLDRGYKRIKASVMSRMKVVVPEITDYSESNIFVIIVSLFAGLVEQLNYYLDNIARESYITSARRYSSLIKITRLIDYRVKTRIGATVDLRITLVDSGGDPVVALSDYTLPSGIIVMDESDMAFITQRKATIFAGSSSVVVGARQGVHIVNGNLGTATSSPGQTYELNSAYQHDTLQVTINSQTWELRETLAFSGPQDRHFIVNVDENKQIWLTFGDDVNGAIPLSGQIIYGTYYTCDGISGNVEEETLVVFDAGTKPTPPAEADDLTVTNPIPAAGGQEIEGIEQIRRRAPLSLRTLGRAVTEQDHEDMTLLIPGVGKAAVEFNAQLKLIDIYIAPEEGGYASNQLLTDVEDYFLTRKMISTFVLAKAAGETPLKIKITCTAKFRRDTTETETDIINALVSEFGFNKSTINRRIRKSDIIALVDNLDKVDYLSLDILTTIPYPRINVGLNELVNNWYAEVTSYSTVVASWRLAVMDSTTARLYQIINGVESFDGNVIIHATDPGSTDYTSQDGSLQLGLWGSFTVSDEWIFNTYPYNEDIELSDFTIPVIDQDILDITVNEQLIAE